MNIVRINRRGTWVFVPILYPGDISTGNWRNFPTSTNRLHAFISLRAARDFIAALGYADTVNAVTDINLENIQRWAEGNEFAPVDLDEIERFDSLMATYFVEVEKDLPSDIDMQALMPLLEKVFNEPKLALYKLPGAATVTEAELQQRANDPVLKKYFLALVRHFERVVYLHDCKANRA